MMRKSHVIGKKAFTLAELVVGIAVLIILAAIAVPTVSDVIERANASADRANAKSIEGAIKYAMAQNEIGISEVTDIAGALALSGIDASEALSARQAGYAFYYDNKTESVGVKAEKGTDDVFLSEDGSNPLLPDGTVGESVSGISAPYGADQPGTTAATAAVTTATAAATTASTTTAAPVMTTSAATLPPTAKMAVTPGAIDIIHDEFTYIAITFSVEGYTEKGSVAYTSDKYLYYGPDGVTYRLSWKSEDTEIIDLSYSKMQKNEFIMKVQSGHAGACSIKLTLKNESSSQTADEKTISATVRN